MRTWLRRSAPVVALAVAAGLLLSGCQKPAPGATVFSGSDSVRQEAACWTFDSGTSIDLKNCGSLNPDQPVPVVSGSTVGVSVDTSVAENGWYAAVSSASGNPQRLTSDPITGTYYRFAVSSADFANGPLLLSLYSLGDSPRVVQGLFVFKLVSAS